MGKPRPLRSAARLQRDLEFTIQWIPTEGKFFEATLSESQIAASRCDDTVAFLEWNALATPSALLPRP